MNRRLTFLATSPVLALLALAPSAGAAEPAAETAETEGASEGRLAVAQAERSITLPAGIVNPEIDFDVTRLAGETYANLSLVGTVGLTDQLNIRGTILPLQLAAPGPSAFRYGQPIETMGPSVGALYRFRRGNVEIGGSLDFGMITVPNTSGIVITPGVPVRFHVGKKLRVDTGAFVPISRLASTSTMTVAGVTTPTGADSFTTTGGLNIPISVLYDLTEPLHVGVSSAFAVGDVSRWSATSSIPASLFAGYAIAGKEGPVLDVDPFFAFPMLLTPGAGPATHTADYAIGLALGGFLYL